MGAGSGATPGVAGAGAPPAVGGAGTGGSANAGGAPSDAGAGGAASATGVPFVYVGSGFYDIPNPQLYVFRLNPETGALSEVQKLGVEPSPSFIAFSPDRRHLYLNIENSPTSAVAFEVDSATGMVSRLNSVQSGANGSAYLALDATGRLLLQANYESGSVVVINVEKDGSLGQVTDQHDLGGSDAYPHCAVVDPTNRFAFVTNRWAPGEPGNYIAQFELDALTGKLTANDPARVDLPLETGPRHLAFHPNGKLAFVNNERSSTVSAYAYDSGNGTLEKQQDLSTLPQGYSGNNAPADLRIHPSGKFLYVSNRGQYSIAIFGVDASTGQLTALGHEVFAGQPRNFYIDPNGRFLVVGNMKGNSVLVYRIDEQTGQLTALGGPVPVSSPSGIAVAYLPGQ